MKRRILAIAAIILGVSLNAQNKPESKIRFIIDESLDFSHFDANIIEGVFSEMMEYLCKNGYVLDPNGKEFSELLNLEEKDEFYADENPGEHTPVKGGIYTLGYKGSSGGGYLFELAHTSKSSDKTYNKSGAYPYDWLKKSEAQKLVAYELIEKIFGLTGDGKRMLETLQVEYKKYMDNIAQAKATQDSLTKKEERAYTARCFLPPVNQFLSGTSKGNVNGWAIVGGYSVSILTFSLSTIDYGVKKRRYDNVSVDLAEADKEREFLNSKMCRDRGFQIASGILFACTYLYGVLDAFANRDTYQKKTELSFAPVAYDNGAGLGIVYRF